MEGPQADILIACCDKEQTAKTLDTTLEIDESTILQFLEKMCAAG